MFISLFNFGFIGPGGPEFILVMLVLLMMFGAKDAPRILRKLNDMLNQIRNTADGFKREIMYGDLTETPSSANFRDLDDERMCDEDLAEEAEGQADPMTDSTPNLVDTLPEEEGGDVQKV